MGTLPASHHAMRVRYYESILAGRLLCGNAFLHGGQVGYPGIRRDIPEFGQVFLAYLVDSILIRLGWAFPR